MYKYLKFFEELTINDIPQVGGKNASLGEMYHHLRPQGVSLPNGVATTADAYATTCMVLGVEKGKEFIQQQKAKAYFIYDNNGILTEYVTENLKPQFSK